MEKNKENRMKKVREIRGYTHEYMAELLNVKRQTYGRYESGERNISNDTLVKIADILGVTTDYLLGRKVSESTHELYEKVQSLSREERKALIEKLRSTI